MKNHEIYLSGASLVQLVYGSGTHFRQKLSRAMENDSDLSNILLCMEEHRTRLDQLNAALSHYLALSICLHTAGFVLPLFSVAAID